MLDRVVKQMMGELHYISVTFCISHCYIHYCADIFMKKLRFPSNKVIHIKNFPQFVHWKITFNCPITPFGSGT